MSINLYEELVPNGLYYYEDVIPTKLEDDILESLIDYNWTPIFKGNREVLHFGYAYDYKQRKSSDVVEPIPTLLYSLLDIAYNLGYDNTFNQCIVNKYLPGQGIGPHTDIEDYGATILCFTLSGGAEMEFTKSGETFKLYTEHCSLYVMTEDSRYIWKHQMRHRKSDIVKCTKVNRRTRISITFRVVNNKDNPLDIILKPIMSTQPNGNPLKVLQHNINYLKSMNDNVREIYVDEQFSSVSKVVVLEVMQRCMKLAFVNNLDEHIERLRHSIKSGEWYRLKRLEGLLRVRNVNIISVTTDIINSNNIVMIDSYDDGGTYYIQ